MKRVIEIDEKDFKFLKESDGCRWSRTIIEGVINSKSLNEVLDEITKKIQAKIVVKPFFDHGDRNRNSNDALLDAIDIVNKYKESEE